jgi:MarR family 2-MHQ and catechol resistance regulon transcriptional repressor
VNAIGAKIRLTSGSITAAVDRLERKGMVERRARVVHLTESGRKTIARAFADHESAMERAVSGLTPAEREARGRPLAQARLHRAIILVRSTQESRAFARWLS